MIINKEKNRFTIRVSLPLIGENGEKWNDILNDEKEASGASHSGIGAVALKQYLRTKIKKKKNVKKTKSCKLESRRG